MQYSSEGLILINSNKLYTLPVTGDLSGEQFLRGGGEERPTS